MKETEKDVIEIMKKYVFGLLVAAMVMSLCACNLETNRKEQPTDDTTVESTVAIDKKEEAKQEEESEQAEVSVDLVGPWHLDSEKNDLNAFEEIFPAYAEFGAGMEIKSNGQMSWYIGAAGGCGSYSLTGDILHAELISDMEQTDMPMGMDSMLPYFQVLPFADILFQNYLFPGIALLIVNGLTNLVAALLLLRKKKIGVVLGGVFGVTLMMSSSIG